MYSIHLKSVGNPDFQQYAPVSEPEYVEAETIGEIAKACQKYQTDWDLGGGNWVDPILRQDGKPIGRFSYNLRLWSLHKSAVNPHGTEITYGGGPEPFKEAAPAPAVPATATLEKEEEEPIEVERKRDVVSLRAKLRDKGISKTRLHKALQAVLQEVSEKEEGDFLDGDHNCTIDEHLYGAIVVIEEYLRGKR